MGARPQKTGCNDPCLPRSNRQESRGGVRGAGAVKMWEPAQWENASVPFRPSLFAKESVGRRKRPMPHTFCNSNIQAPTPRRLRHPTGPNSLLEGRRTGEKPATNSVGCNAIDEDFEPAFFASQKVCGIRQNCPPHNGRVVTHWSRRRGKMGGSGKHLCHSLYRTGTAASSSWWRASTAPGNRPNFLY